MGNDTRRSNKPRDILLRVVLVSGTGLLACMGLLYYITGAARSGYDEAGRMITITTEYVSSHASMKMGHGMDISSMTHYDEGTWVDKEFTAPEDIWVTEFSSEFTGVSVHNFYVFIKDTHDAWCPDNPTAIYSGGTVSAKRPITFDAPYGVFIKKGTTLILRAFYHEMEGDVSNDTLSFSVHARFEPAASTTRSVPISLYFITPGPCTYTRPVFPVPAHANNVLYSSEQKPFVFPDDGKILKAMAHFHAAYKEGVTNTVRLFLNKNMIDSFTTTNVGDEAERNPRLLTDRLVTIRRGDILTMHAIFSNPSATAVPEGMAIIGFYFAPQKQ